MKESQDKDSISTVCLSSNGLSDASANTHLAHQNETGIKEHLVEDPNEIILSYPPIPSGSVNITRADFKRLQPGGYLNDTLIEFGLKLWHHELSATDAELAKQIHIFNSFFYKKLNNQNLELGYQSVRKWTKKVDIFTKKFIIIPVNEDLHWYLVVIYQPMHVLVPPSERPASSDISSQSLKDAASYSHGDADNSDTAQISSSSFRVTAELATNTDNDYPTLFASVDGCEDVDVEGELREPASTHLMDLDDAFSRRTQDLAVNERASRVHGMVSTSPSNFYAEPSSKNNVVDADHTLGIPGVPTTRIFILDSLGVRHPRVARILSSYLQMEAKDKKSIKNPSKAIGGHSAVLVQPNYCDCGIYLLHFARVFVKKAPFFCQLSASPKKGNNRSSEERQEDWDMKELQDFRESLRTKVIMLSNDWKRGTAGTSEREV